MAAAEAAWCPLCLGRGLGACLALLLHTHPHTAGHWEGGTQPPEHPPSRDTGDSPCAEHPSPWLDAEPGGCKGHQRCHSPGCCPHTGIGRTKHRAHEKAIWNDGSLAPTNVPTATGAAERLFLSVTHGDLQHQRPPCALWGCSPFSPHSLSRHHPMHKLSTTQKLPRCDPWVTSSSSLC